MATKAVVTKNKSDIDLTSVTTRPRLNPLMTCSCGARILSSDVAAHECNPANIPAQGQEVVNGKVQPMNTWKSQ